MSSCYSTWEYYQSDLMSALSSSTVRVHKLCLQVYSDVQEVLEFVTCCCKPVVYPKGETGVQTHDRTGANVTVVSGEQSISYPRISQTCITTDLESRPRWLVLRYRSCSQQSVTLRAIDTTACRWGVYGRVPAVVRT